MCWCEPTMRTPCCGSFECHRVQIVKGHLKPGEKCPLCKGIDPKAFVPVAAAAPTRRELTQIVRVVTESQCPRCRRYARLEEELSSVELERWATIGDDRISVALDSGKTKLVEDLAKRGWTDEMCGLCRDGDAGKAFSLEGLVAQRAESVGLEAALKEFHEALERVTPRTL